MREEHSDNLSDSEHLDRLRLSRSQYVGAVTFHQMIERFGSAAAALDALPDLARRGGRTRTPRIYNAAEAMADFDFLDRRGGRIVVWGDPDYPPRLAMLVDAPPVLSVLGHVELLRKKAVAMVGARNASANGCRLAESLAAEIGRTGYLIVSGQARGIDASAHRGALASGTVAVLGCGIDVVYPQLNADLYTAIADTGALVSELAPETKPAARHFPRRNRIISGMARGVVVVEASLKSGSLIAARLAGEQGREVFAVPGAATDPRGRGTNALIRDGAVLTETADDVLAVLEDLPQTAAWPSPVAPPDVDLTDAEPPADLHEAVLAALGPAPTPRDDLVRRMDVPAAAVASVLMELELAGRLESHPGNMVSLADGP